MVNSSAHFVDNGMRERLDEHISIQACMTEKLEDEDERRRKRAESRNKEDK